MVLTVLSISIILAQFGDFGSNKLAGKKCRVASTKDTIVVEFRETFSVGYVLSSPSHNVVLFKTGHWVLIFLFV